MFDGGGIMVHDRVRQEMRQVLAGSDIPVFLDPTAKMLLVKAREAYQSALLDSVTYIKEGNDLILMNWHGDWTNNALAMFLTALGCNATNEGIAVRIAVESHTALAAPFEKIAKATVEELLAFVGKAKNLQSEKWDWALPADLLIKSYASTRLDLLGAQNEAKRLLSGDGCP